MVERYKSSPIARIVISEGGPGRRRNTQIPWSAKVYDESGNLRSGVNHPTREYVERWIAEYFPGVPIEIKSTQRDARKAEGSIMAARKQTLKRFVIFYGFPTGSQTKYAINSTDTLTAAYDAILNRHWDPDDREMDDLSQFKIFDDEYNIVIRMNRYR